MLHLISLHSRLQVTITLVLTALFLWGLICALRGAVSQHYTAALWVAVLLVAAQALIGLLIFFGLGLPVRMAMHLIYGAIAISMLPGAILALRGRSGRREALTYAIICLLMVVVAMRAYETGVSQ